MEGSPKTPERTLVNDGDEGIDDSSPLKPLRPPVAGHNAEEVARRTMPTTMQAVSVDKMYEMLGTTKEDMNKAFPPLPKPGAINDQNNITEYLNRLSDIVHQYLS
jgi:hypothetical protein